MKLEGLDLARAMQANPKFAEMVMGQVEHNQNMQNASQLSSDYAGIEKFLQNREAARAQAHNQTPVQVPLRRPELPELTPIQQWRNRNDALMASGNPILQKEAINQMASINQESVKGPEYSTGARMALESGYQPGTKGFQDFVERYAFKTQQNYEAELDKPYTTAELKEYVDKDGNDIKPGTTRRQGIALGAKLRGPKIAGGDIGRYAPVKVVAKKLPELKNYLIDPNTGNMKQSIVRQMNALDATSGDTFLSKLSRGVVNLTFADKDAQRAYNIYDQGLKAITRAETGAALQSEEIGHTVSRFFPSSTEDLETQNLKFQAFTYLIENSASLYATGKEIMPEATPKELIDLAAELAISQTILSSNSSSASGDKSKRKPGDTWVEGGYEYKIMEDGRQARKKVGG